MLSVLVATSPESGRRASKGRGAPLGTTPRVGRKSALELTIFCTSMAEWVIPVFIITATVHAMLGRSE